MNQESVTLKDKLDTLNSLSWFFMDAFWMLDFTSTALVLGPVVLGSGLLLVSLDRRPAHLAINLAIVSWISMNILWVYSEHVGDETYRGYSRLCFFAGMVLIGLAVFLSKNIRETFSHFRRFRIKKWIE